MALIDVLVFNLQYIMLMFDKFLLENMLEAEVKKFTEKRLF